MWEERDKGNKPCTGLTEDRYVERASPNAGCIRQETALSTGERTAS